MADRSSREIERELEQKRAELRSTIDEALDRMTLEGAWTYAGQYLRDNRRAYGQTLGSVIKEKPLAVGLVAIGMAWIMFGPSTADRGFSREEDYRRADRQDDAKTRARLEAGDFDDTSARGPTGPDARPDPWAAPSHTPSPAPARPEAGTAAVGGTSSPATSTPTTPGGTSSSSIGTPSGSSATRGSTGGSKVAAPAVVPASSPARTGGTTSSGSTSGSGTNARASETSSNATTTNPKSPKV